MLYIAPPKKKIYYAKCLICQTDGKGQLHTVSDIKRVRELLLTRCKCNAKYHALRKDCQQPNFLQKRLVWHRTCRQKFLSCDLHGGLQEANMPATPARLTRTLATEVSFSYADCCIICGKKGSTKRKSENLLAIKTIERQQKLSQHAERLLREMPAVFARSKDKNLIQLSAKYHQKCMLSFFKKKTEEETNFSAREAVAKSVVDEIETRLKEGRIYSLSELRQKLSSGLASSGLEIKAHDVRILKKQLSVKYGKALEVSSSKKADQCFYYLKHKVSVGALSRQVSKFVKEADDSVVLVESPTLDTDCETNESGRESDSESFDCEVVWDSEDDMQNSGPESVENGTQSPTGSQPFVNVPDWETPHCSNSMNDMFEHKAKSEFFYTVKRLKADLIDTVKKYKRSDKYIDITTEYADSMIPPMLFNMLAFLFADFEDPPDNASERYSVTDAVKEDIISLAQDILFQVGKLETPKHTGLGVYVYHKTRNKNLITLLNRLKMTVSYSTVQRIVTNEAMKAKEQQERTDNVHIPEGIVPGDFIHFSLDNLDFEVSIKI